MSAELTGPTSSHNTQDVRQFALCLSLQYRFEKGKAQVLKCAFCGLVSETQNHFQEQLLLGFLCFLDN